MPDYLSMDNVLFVRLIEQLNRTCSSMLAGEQVQQMALCHHQLAALHIQQEIYLLYLRLGTGQFVANEIDLCTVDRRWWPSQVRTIVNAKRPTTLGLSRDEENCLSEQWVHRALQEVEHKKQIYEQSLLEKKAHFEPWLAVIDGALQTYVQQHGLRSYRLKGDLKKAVLVYDYQLEMLQRQYVYERPNEYQVSVRTSLVVLVFLFGTVLFRCE